MSGFTAGEGRVEGRKGRPGRAGGSTPVRSASVSCTKTRTSKYIRETPAPRYIAVANSVLSKDVRMLVLEKKQHTGEEVPI